MSININLHKNDLPDDLKLGNVIAIDGEFMGLDVRRDILKNLQDSFDDDSYAPHPLLEKLVSENRLGKKTGMGIYDWSNGNAEETEMPEF